VQQQIAVITLGISNLGRSKKFYGEGFGWKPVFENDEIAFYQMNGLVLGTWLQSKLSADMNAPDIRATDVDVSNLHRPGAFALAHNVESEQEVKTVLAKLAQAGGRILREGDAPPHGGFRGYVADPDDHAWEIAFNPAWKIDERGSVTFGA
jgi:catechol 2,3-dioxygenase-like lactoylglutathione lyase family enzyme